MSQLLYKHCLVFPLDRLQFALIPIHLISRSSFGQIPISLTRNGLPMERNKSQARFSGSVWVLGNASGIDMP